MRIGLAGCVKGKRRTPAEARELYTSPLFVKRRAYVEWSCDSWYVLSALHVLGQLRSELGDVAQHVFELHAGRNYWGFGLREGLERLRATVENPTEGLGIGKQLSFYGRAP